MGRSPSSDENGLKKGPWSPEEDQKLIQYIQKHGHGSWRALPKNAGLNRCGKSCRLRWTNYLRPDIKRGKFSDDEEQTILNLHSILGNKWSAIATHLPGRTDNEIKNFWNTHLKKKLIQMGFDPMTHRPRTELYSNLPHLMALANLSEIMTYHHQQQQQYQQHQQHLHQPPLEEYAVGFESEAAQFARHQYLQCLLQSAVEAVTSSSSNANNITDTEAINMLALPSSTRPNGVDEETVAWDSLNFDNTSSSLGFVPSNSATTHQLFVPTQSNLQITSNLQELKDPTMNRECNQGSSFLDMLHQEESILKSRLMPPIIRAGSFNQPENYVTNQVDGLNNSGCGASSFWPELFFEEPFIYEIA